jgi:putative heme transporter
MTATTRRRLQVALGFGLAVALLVWGLPYFAKTSWSAVFHVLGAIPVGTVISLQCLMLLGLWMYTFTLTGALPGLRHTRALIVNVCGSSVGNLLPGGGAAGLAATYTICRSWGFSRRDISTAAIVTGVWNVLARVALPVVGIAALYIGSSDLPQAAQDAAVAATLGGLAVLGAFVAILVSEPAAQAIGHGLDWALRPLRRRSRRRGTMRVDELVADLRSRIIGVVRSGWLQMTYGLGAFFAIYFVLFWFCMNAVGVHMRFGTLFAAYAIGRLLTAVGVTPGGLGVTETGTATVLVGWGADPAQATAGVVLFSIFTHLMEIPLGAIGWVAWTLTRPPPGTERVDGGDGAARSGPVPGSSPPRVPVDLPPSGEPVPHPASGTPPPGIPTSGPPAPGPEALGSPPTGIPTSGTPAPGDVTPPAGGPGGAGPVLRARR